ncbi:MAG: FprA family A-type flavoprotein [Lachnospiraceae bacterium]
MYISDDIFYIGVNDHRIDLFEGQYPVPHGMSYNSYVIMDEKIAVMDTVDAGFTEEWLLKLSSVLSGRKPDYLVIQHMEPDHSAGIADSMEAYPDTCVVSFAPAFTMMKQFFGSDFNTNRMVIKEGDTLGLGRHELTFVAAPMVHWPEVMVTYDACDQILFSADGFGKFGALDEEEAWTDGARRYYFGIVGRFGMQVQNLLKKASRA